MTSGDVFVEPGRRSLKNANLTGRQHLVSELSLRLHTAPFAGYRHTTQRGSVGETPT